MTRAVVRTAFTNLRSRPLQTGLTGLVLLASAATLTLALNLRRGADAPFERAFAATNGAHVVAVADRASTDLAPLTREPGVVGSSGPDPLVFHRASFRGRPGERLMLLGLTRRHAVGRPVLTAGRWLGGDSSDEVVLEHSFARSKQLGVGDTAHMAVRGRTVDLAVVGVALTTGRGPYPNWNPGLAWIPNGTLAALGARPSELHGVLGLKLADAAASGAFVTRAGRLYSSGVHFYDWREVRADVAQRTREQSVVLQAFGLFALLAVGLIIANAIGGRVLAQFREIGLLKAIGFTPRQVTALFLTEQLALGLTAALAGSALGAAASAPFLRQSARVLGTPAANAFDPATLALSVAGVCAVVAAFTILPAWRAAGSGPCARSRPGSRPPSASRRGSPTSWYGCACPRRSPSGSRTPLRAGGGRCSRSRASR
jgi:putative ABC transport system permease protein